MTNPRIHKVLITTGCLIWFASFLGEAFRGQPYSTIGIIISPILTFTGIFYWVKHYHQTRGHYPNLNNIWHKATYAGSFRTFDLLFLVKNFLAFWTFCIVIWMVMISFMVLIFRRSNAFEVTRHYCETNREILSQTGEIKYYGVLIGGTISTGGDDGNADLSFTIVGANGNFKANSELTNQDGIWTVDKLELQ